MEQRAAEERQRGESLSRRGNAEGSRAPDAYARRAPRPEEPPPSAPAGRHRSPWGRSGRILPIRWGRIAAGSVVALAVVGVLIGYALLSGSGPKMAGTSSGGSAPASRPTDDTNRVTVAGPSPTGAGAGPNSVSASPAPGTVLGLLPTGPPVPPPPTASRPASTLVATPAGPRSTGPVLTLGRTSVSLGQVDSTDTVDLTNTGTEAFTIRTGGAPSYLDATPRATRLDPGYRTQLVISLDRSAAPVGQLDIPITVAPVSGTGGGTIHVTAVVTAGPRILSAAAPSSLRAQACVTDQAPATGTLTVEVQDPVGMSGGTVATTAPNGATATVALQLGSTTDDRSTWTAQLGPSATAGTLAYTVTVKDLNNRVATKQGSLTVAECS
ncbi:hypothetical protein [Pseudofrankia sp. BMG5.36]|uniref:hypothetical protein n=1 Tax=Pseudofrankia sp. BMG5.36 TaxID=1834512 RepID=UPI0008D9FDF6|nr:hypothetical protein [Pseudofrankia sp. BMG5.36]OHV57272.1 hypothetical protein BCD48_06595 [Pseudofrankia sp. BMG5.36]